MRGKKSELSAPEYPFSDMIDSFVAGKAPEPKEPMIRVSKPKSRAAKYYRPVEKEEVHPIEDSSIRADIVGSAPPTLDELTAFAQALVLSDMDVRQACVTGGFNWQQAVAIQQHPGFRDALESRLPDAVKTGIVSPAAVVAEICAIAFSDISDFIDTGESGKEANMRPLAEIPWTARRAIKSFEITETATGKKSLRVVMYDKMTALNALKEVVFPKEMTRRAPKEIDVHTIDDFQEKLAALTEERLDEPEPS